MASFCIIYFMINERAEWPSNWAKQSVLHLPYKKKAAFRILPSLSFKIERLRELDSLRESSPGQIERISTLTADKIAIDGAIVWADEERRFAKKPWILYFNGNGESYEDNLRVFSWYSKETGCNVCGFNYRGVGYSAGMPYQPEDLVLDGDAVFQYLTRRGVAESKILIHARSLGGPVGTSVRRLHPNGPICNERSFSSWAKIEKQFQMKATKWEFYPLKDWSEIRGQKWIIVSPTDEVIDYETTSFYKAVEQAGEAATVIMLPELYSLMKGGGKEGHNVPLSCKEYAGCWARHKELVASSLH